MYDKIENYLLATNSKNTSREFLALIFMAILSFENDDFAMISFLDKEYYGRIVSAGYGFSGGEVNFSPSVVEFGEFVEFLNKEIQQVVAGKRTKDETRRWIKRYLVENLRLN